LDSSISIIYRLNETLLESKTPEVLENHEGLIFLVGKNWVFHDEMPHPAEKTTTIMAGFNE